MSGAVLGVPLAPSVLWSLLVPEGGSWLVEQLGISLKAQPRRLRQQENPAWTDLSEGPRSKPICGVNGSVSHTQQASLQSSEHWVLV